MEKKKPQAKREINHWAPPAEKPLPERGAGRGRDRATKPREEHGIPDWDLKFEALKRAVYNAGSKKIMVAKVLKLAIEKYDTGEVEQIVDASKNWETSFPTRPFAVAFMEKLVASLKDQGCSGSLAEIDWALTREPFADFCKLFPEITRARMERGGLSGTGSHFPLWVPTDDARPLVHEVVRKGRVDYKLYYGNSDSYDVWERVIDAKNYHQYIECLDCIQQLTTHPRWIDGFQSGQLAGVVMLGAGSSDKDAILLTSMANLLGPKRTVRYTLIDYSTCMLEETRRQILEYCVHCLPGRAVHVEAVRHDFLIFPSHAERIRPTNENVVWAIPGGTFGNQVDEDRFFASLATQVKSGDLLVIAADTSREGLTEKYAIAEVRRFVEPALRQAWFELKLEGALDRFMEERILTAPVDALRAGHSKVPDTLAVEISIELDGKKTILLTSCRYAPEALVNFVTSKGYVHRDTIASRANDKFKHFVFTAA